MKKIAFIGNVPDPVGGAEVFLENLISELLSCTSLQIVLARWLETFRLEGTTRIRYRYKKKETIEVTHGGRLKTYYLFRKTFSYGFPRVCRALYDALKLTIFLSKEHVSLLHCHLLVPNIYYSFIAARLLRKPLIVTIHGSVDIVDQGYFFRIPLIQRIERRILIQTLRRCDLVLAVSAEIVRLCRDRGIDRVVKMECGIDTDFFMPNSGHEEGLLFIGNLTKRKGFPLLVSAYKQIKDDVDDQLFLAGKNPHGFVSDDPQIQYVGCLRKPELLRLIQQVKLVILPSETEGLPISIMEALACNKMVLVSKVGQLEHLIKEGENGFFIRNRDAGDLARQIRHILANYDRLRVQLGRQPRDSIARYDISHVVDRHLKLYHTCSSRRTAKNAVRSH